jgi:hypothetical protein
MKLKIKRIKNNALEILFIEEVTVNNNIYVSFVEKSNLILYHSME